MYRALVFACLILPGSFGAARAADEALPAADIIFVTSTGFWEESGDPLAILDPTGKAGEPQKPGEPQAEKQRGYYKLIAVRQPDGTAAIHLQQIEATAAGPKIASSAVLEEFSAMKPYVTDIRPENSSGVTAQPGLFATVYLKTDPKAVEPESWTVLIDDLGAIKVERATN